ncbi:MAG TPA: hypothetical protein VLS27_20710 [Gammaproteobacteria bacterium]|nr:hypothetical protein [Gammaproteobacteria bacterium]
MSNTRAITTVRAVDRSEKTSTSLVSISARDSKLRSGPVVMGEEQLLRLRRAIVGGDYQVDSKRIAVKLLKRG